MNATAENQSPPYPTPDPLAWLPISHSRATDMSRCGFLAWATHIMRCHIEPTPALAKGTALHTALQSYYQDTPVQYSHDIEYEYSQILRIINSTPFLLKQHALAAELPFAISLAQLPNHAIQDIPPETPIFAGRYDLVSKTPDSTIHITDFKSTTASYSDPPQLQIYAVAAAALFPACQTIATHIVNPSGVAYSRSYSRTDLSDLSLVLADWALSLARETSTAPNPAETCLAHFGAPCPILHRCPAWSSLPDDIALSVADAPSASAPRLAALRAIIENPSDPRSPAEVSLAYQALKTLQQISRQATAALKKHLSVHPSEVLTVETTTITEVDSPWILSELAMLNIPLADIVPFLKWTGGPSIPLTTPRAREINATLLLAPSKQTNRHNLKPLKETSK